VIAGQQATAGPSGLPLAAAMLGGSGDQSTDQERRLGR
jgi:hypothetical protein